MPVASAFGQFESTNMVAFKLLDTTGTPSITEVFPHTMSSNISVVDTAQGRATITITNFKGGDGYARIFLTGFTTSLSSNAVTPSYSGNDLSFEISTEDDASSATDASVNVLVLAY